MVYADLKNDFVFRRVFATHPDLLLKLLNDLLEREGDETIEGIEYLPGEQVPLFDGGKLSILDVRCKDRRGATFVVEMQLIHHPGFINRVVYNACKAYAGQLKAGEWYTHLTDVIAISICDFELWTDADQDRQHLPHIPMLSRWNMTERASKSHGLLQVQYAFLELPKLPAQRPEAGPGLWAWLFVHATELKEVPSGLPPGEYQQALELANQASFTQLELDAYQKARDEIRQVLEIVAERQAQARAEGRVVGHEEGRVVGHEEGRVVGHEEGRVVGRAEGELRATTRMILTALAARGVAVDAAARAQIEGCTDVMTLERWMVRAVAASSVDDVFATRLE